MREMYKAHDPMGRAALFSGKPREEGPFTIECAGCRAHSRIRLSRLIRIALPINFTNPLRYHHTWLKCPACDKRNWVRIRTDW